MPEMRAAVSARVGPYELIDRLGYGGMAEVYVARSASMQGGRRVAIKRILPQFGRDARFVSMFCDEARISAALSHPNIVQVLDFGEDSGELFMVMEYVDGASCAKLLRAVAARGQRFPVSVALYVAREVLNALSFAHDAWDENGRPLGIVHRDVSPGNVLIARTGEVKLTDFGIMRSEFITRRTYPGELKGKLGYMAPEQVVGKEVDPRSDLFALGIVLAEMLIARPLFPGPSEMDILTRIYEADIGVLERFRGDIPDEVFRMLTIALARDRRDRFANARAFLQALAETAGHLGLTLARSELSSWLCELGVVPATSGVREAAARTAAGDDVPTVHAPLAPLHPGPPSTRTERGSSSERRPRSSPKATAAIAGGARTLPTYCVHGAQGPVGPFSLAQLLAMTATGAVSRDTLVSAGDDLPRQLDRIPAVRRLLQSGDREFGDRLQERATWTRALDRARLPELLFQLVRHRETGLLAVRCDHGEKRIYWVDGVVRCITSTRPEELLGARLTQSGAVTQEEIEEALQVTSAGGSPTAERLGEALVAQGKLAPTTLLRAVVRQLRDRFTDLGRWRFGELHFVRGELPKQRLPRCPAPGLVSALVRRGYDGRELRELLAPLENAPLAAAPVPSFKLTELELTEHEAVVVAAAPGSSSYGRFEQRMTRQHDLREPVVRRAVFLALSAGVLVSPGWAS
jgi:serine/threonine protein kinase